MNHNAEQADERT